MDFHLLNVLNMNSHRSHKLLDTINLRAGLVKMKTYLLSVDTKPKFLHDGANIIIYNLCA